MSDQLVGICGALALGILGSPPQICDLPAGHAGWHGADNVTPAGWPSTRTSWANETDWPAEVAALRQQLDEARGEQNRLAKSLDDAVSHLDDESAARGDAEGQLVAARRSIEGLRERMIAAEADRDRLLVVYRAAEAWAEVGRTRTSQTGNSSIWLHEYGNRRDALIAAVDAYRSAAPAEPAAEPEDGGYDPRCCRFPKSCSCWKDGTEQ